MLRVNNRNINFWFVQVILRSSSLMWSAVRNAVPCSWTFDTNDYPLSAQNDIVFSVQELPILALFNVPHNLIAFYPGRRTGTRVRWSFIEDQNTTTQSIMEYKDQCLICSGRWMFPCKSNVISLDATLILLSASLGLLRKILCISPQSMIQNSNQSFNMPEIGKAQESPRSREET